MKKEFKNLLVGLTLGNGYITKKSNYIQIQHDLKQKDYLQYKINLIHLYSPESKIKTYEYNNNGHSYIKIRYSNSFCKYIKNWLYKDGYKKIKKELLYRLSDREIALWYMDKGSLYKSCKNTKYIELIISTYCNTEEEALDLIEFMRNRYDAIFSIKRNKGKFSIRCGKKSAIKFLSKIQPFIIDSMKYKTFENFK